MLEILLLIFFSKKIAANAEEKGYSGVVFILLFIGCWFCGEIIGAILGGVFLQSMGAAYGLAIALAFAGTIFAFSVVALLPNNSDERFDSLGRHRIRGKSRKRRRPVEVDDDDSYREKFQTRRQQEVEELEEVEDELEIIEEEEVKKPPLRKVPPRPPVRKPAPSSDGARIQKPEQKIAPRPPLRKPGPG